VEKWGRVYIFDNLVFVRPNVTLDISWRQINGGKSPGSDLIIDTASQIRN